MPAGDAASAADKESCDHGRPGRGTSRSKPNSARSAWSCPARSPTAPPAASAPDATATPTPRNCTAPTRPGPAKSAAGPSPGPSPPKTPNGSAPTSTPTATCASSSPNSKPSPSSSPGSPGHHTHSHAPSREISPLNAGSAHRKPAKTTGQRVLSLAHPEWCCITSLQVRLEHADGPAGAFGLPPALTGPGSPCGRQP